MFEKSLIRRTILQMSNFGLLSGVVLWVLLVVHGAQRITANPHLQEYAVQFGPITLTRITRRPVVDGFVASFSLEAGLVGYVVGWIIVGALIGLFLILFARKQPPPRGV